MGPAGAAAVGMNEEMLGVFGVFFSEENVKVASLESSVPGHGVGELGGRDFSERSFWGNIGLFEPSGGSRDRKDESKRKKKEFHVVVRPRTSATYSQSCL